MTLSKFLGEGVLTQAQIGRIYRALYNMSLKDFAKGVGLSSSAISNYEAGRTYSTRLDNEYDKMRYEVISILGGKLYG